MSENGRDEKSTGHSQEDYGALIRYPAFSFSGGLLYCVTSPDSLTVCSKLGYKSRFYKKLFLVDSAGNRFNVIAAERVRRLVQFTFRGFLELIDGNPRWQVRLIYGRPLPISLADVKALIATCFRKEQDSWEEMSDFDEFRDKVAQATSLEMVFATFKEFNKI